MRVRTFFTFATVILPLLVLTVAPVFAEGVAENNDDATTEPNAWRWFTIPESTLLDSEFSKSSWGGIATRADAYGDLVLFTFSGLSPSSTGVKDNYPVATLYGQIVPSHGNGDFSDFDGYSLWVQNLDERPIGFSLFINTGFTGPSGVPSNDWRNDTFWQSPWVDMAPGEARTLTLEFDNAIPWNISDNPLPHTQGSNGLATAINPYDRTEVSAVGFQVYANSNTDAVVLVGPPPPPSCIGKLKPDLNGDCRVDFIDLSILASVWLESSLDPL